MRRTNAWWISIAAAGLGTALVGCGGSDQVAEPEFAPLAQPSAPAPAPAPAPAAAPEAIVAAPAPGSEAPVVEAAAPAVSRAGRSPDAAATEDLFALAKAGPSGLAVAEGGEDASGDSSSSPSPDGYPQPGDGYSSGSMMSSSGMRSDYPGMGGNSQQQQQQQRSGYMAGSMGSGYPGMNDGYPGGSGAPPGMSDGYPSEMSGAGYPGSGGGPSGSGGATEPDFSNPIKGAETFLAAVQARDPVMLSHSIALRAPQEAVPKNRPIFQKFLDGPGSVDEETLNLIFEALKDMKIMGTNQVRSTARLGVIVGRQEPNGDSVTRTIEMRKEKEGWKVNDVGGPRITVVPAHMKTRPGQGGQTGGSEGGSSGGYPGSGGSSSGYGQQNSGGGGAPSASPR